MADKDNQTLMNHLQLFQNKAAKATLGLPPWSSATNALKLLNLLSLTGTRFHHRCLMVHKCLSA